MSEVVRIATAAMRLMVGDSEEDPDLVLLSSPGSSGARVSVFRQSRTSMLYAVKCLRGGRVQVVEEAKRAQVLAPSLGEHLPRVVWCEAVDGWGVMISECAGLQTLHSMVVNSDLPHSRLLRIWRSVTSSLVATWSASQHPYAPDKCPRHYPSRVRRIEQSLYNLEISGVPLARCWDLPIVIGDRQHPSLADTVARLSHVGQPDVGVLCHGDPQPSNIIVTESDDWYCVDWEWTGYNHDWRMMVSHLYGWWTTRCLASASEPQVRVRRTCLEIIHDAFVPGHMLDYQSVSVAAAERMAGGAVIERDARDINLFLAALYLSELRFLHLWGRQAFAPIMLAYGVIAASRWEVVRAPHVFPGKHVSREIEPVDDQTATGDPGGPSPLQSRQRTLAIEPH